LPHRGCAVQAVRTVLEGFQRVPWCLRLERGRLEMGASASVRPQLGFSGKRGEPGHASGWYAADSAGNTWYFWFDTSGRLRRAPAATAEASGFAPNTEGQILGSFVAVAALAAVDTAGGVFSWQ